MPRILSNAQPSPEVRLPDRIGYQRVRPDGKGPMPSDFGHGQRIWDAVVRGHGSVKATAFTMGEKDESLIRRQITDGTIRLREFFEADDAALCEFAEYVLETFQPTRRTRRQIARDALPQLFTALLDATEEDK